MAALNSGELSLIPLGLEDPKNDAREFAFWTNGINDIADWERPKQR